MAQQSRGFGIDQNSSNAAKATRQFIGQENVASYLAMSFVDLGMALVSLWWGLL